MSDSITVRGWVGTEPTKGLTRNNRLYSRFRVSVTERWRDQERQAWVDGHTNWFTVQCYGDMAENVAASVRKGQRIIVVGKLQLRTFQRADGTFGSEAVISASSVGQDLAMGMGTWNRRRDEEDSRRLADRPAYLEGVGAVNLGTGEVTAEGAVEDPFGPESLEFDDAFLDVGGAPYGDEEHSATDSFAGGAAGTDSAQAGSHPEGESLRPA
ncbi:hypothetical protein GCM10012320_08830 [Sinomonas cellulolyticus]|uniref:Single-stranded DNA-binding protein n=1 Tax=Sinomonas cellulolyticus TaxID=2801916 RepID=A0ABS1K4A9_9MICC|nr:MULTISPECIES: single-stranded DNA-binding protein [Sinomonas]MBL0706343.1 single-stranded DNA-binding protein [Sinomonas cellulolyticus]GHG44154.1 hypothetical protein GCM10012320_08830 [Sinomonas sp. KCTC 49339]